VSQEVVLTPSDVLLVAYYPDLRCTQAQSFASQKGTV
jgi:hypothetical protein